MAKLDRAPLRAVSLLERAKAEAKSCLDKIESKHLLRTFWLHDVEQVVIVARSHLVQTATH